MCRRKSECELLGNDPSEWSRAAPLPPPAWFNEAIDLFAAAVDLASHGALGPSQAALSLIRNADLREFYVEHGQMSYRFRAGTRRPQKNLSEAVGLDPLKRIPGPLTSSVLERDGYRCRFCGIRVVPKRVLVAFASVVGPEAFPTGNSNATRHGVVLAFRANVDHVLPYRAGGRTNLENLVTACWSCNYGKNSFRLEELGLDDPRTRAPELIPGWFGLTEHVPDLRRVQRSLSQSA